MMYRERGSKTVVIRTKYDSDKKRGVQKVVVSLPTKDLIELSFDGEVIQSQIEKNELTEAEIAEFKEWFEVTQNALNSERKVKDNDSAATWIRISTDLANDLISEEQAQTLYAEMRTLKSKLRELGHKEKRVKPDAIGK